MTRRSRHHGIFLLDLMMAIVVLLALATVLSIAINRTAGAADKLANDREAIEVAQRTLLALQAGQRVSESDDRVKVKIERLNEGWTRVSVAVDGRRATLTGWIPGGGQ